MSQWITKRRPTNYDADTYGMVWACKNDGVYRVHYEYVLDDDRIAWQPIIAPKPYVKPKKYKATLDLDGDPIVLEIATGTTWAAAKTREAAERIAAIYEETDS